MCYCTPNIRTPFCGKKRCVPPGVVPKRPNLTFTNDQLAQHIKSAGIYKVLEIDAKREDDGTHVVVYRRQSTGEIWVRPYSEFVDKFTNIP